MSRAILRVMASEEGENLGRLRGVLETLSGEGLDARAALEFIAQREERASIPAGAFDCRLSPLETLVLFLDSRHGMRLTEMARLLGRSPSTIWVTLKRAGKKIRRKDFETHLAAAEGPFVPVREFGKGDLSVLEQAVWHLKSRHSLTPGKIADILGKNERTVWTVLFRAKRKLLGR